MSEKMSEKITEKQKLIIATAATFYIEELKMQVDDFRLRKVEDWSINIDDLMRDAVCEAESLVEMVTREVDEK